VRLGTRSSALALAQAEAVAAALGGAEVVPVKTADARVGDKARFVRGIEAALLEGDADLGVHSAKDLPGELPDGLALVGVPGREDPSDAFVGAADSLAAVGDGARIGSPDERVVLATAGLARLGRRGEIAFRFELDELTPAPGQGCLALEARADDDEAAAAAGRISDPAALTELTAERAATRSLGATCDTPLGICARFEGDELSVTGYAGLPDGSEWVRDRVAGDPEQPAALGEALAERMLGAGAADILERAAGEAR